MASMLAWVAERTFSWYSRKPSAALDEISCTRAAASRAVSLALFSAVFLSSMGLAPNWCKMRSRGYPQCSVASHLCTSVRLVLAVGNTALGSNVIRTALPRPRCPVLNDLFRLGRNERTPLVFPPHLKFRHTQNQKRAQEAGMPLSM